MTRDDDSKQTSLSAATVSALLGLGVPSRGRPVDLLIKRLASGDARLFDDLLAEVRLASGEPAADALLNGSLDLDTLHDLRRRGKKSFGHADNDDDRCTGLLGYFLAIAAGLAQHGVNLTDRPRDEVNESLVDLAEHTPAEVTALLVGAALAG